MKLFLFLLALVLVFFGIKYLYRSRASAMRALALRLGFQYSDGDPQKWHLSKVHSPLPAWFDVSCHPANGISRVWNVIEGTKDGVRA